MAVLGNTQALDTSGPMFKSYDSGVTWLAINNGLDATSVVSLAIDPISPNVIYAGTDRGVFKSIDGGEYWIQPNNVSSLFAMKSIVIVPSNPSVLYGIGLEGPQKNKGFLISTNAGMTWDIISAGKYQGERVTPEKIALDPLNPSILYIQSKKAVFKSVNGGKKWILILTFPDTGLADYPRDIKVASIAPSTLYVIGSNRVYKTTDSGSTWVDLTGRIRQSVDESFNDSYIFFTVTIDPTNPSVIFVVAGEWLYKSLDGGDTWLPKGDSNAFHLMIFDPRTPATIYGLSYQQAFKSSNGGINWSAINFPNRGFHDLAVDPRTPSILYAGSFGPPLTTPWIYGLIIEEERLVVSGVNFDKGAVILLDGIEQQTKNHKALPGAILIGKKAGRKVGNNPGLKIQVRNPDGNLSQEAMIWPAIN
jgi:photosystem II stability/assembly factor-like uncharacterized protein